MRRFTWVMEWFEHFTPWVTDPGFAGSIVSAVIGACVVLYGLKRERLASDRALLESKLEASRERTVEVVAQMLKQLRNLYTALQERDSQLAKDAAIELVALNSLFAVDTAKFYPQFQIAFSQSIHALNAQSGLLFHGGYDDETREAIAGQLAKDVDFFMSALTAWAAEDDLVDVTVFFAYYAEHGRFPDALYEDEASTS